MVEGRLGELALAAPELSFAREQSAAEDVLDAHVVAALDVVCVVLQKNVLDRVAVVQQEKEMRPEAVANDVAELPRALEQQGDGIAPSLEQTADQGEPA